MQVQRASVLSRYFGSNLLLSKCSASVAFFRLSQLCENNGGRRGSSTLEEEAAPPLTAQRLILESDLVDVFR